MKWFTAEMKIKPVRLLLMVLIVIAILGPIAWKKGMLTRIGLYRPANSIFVISPYDYEGMWVFDDRAVGLVREPFVAGIPEIIEDMVKDINDPQSGFRLIFSAREFPEYTHKLTWIRHGDGGDWYRCEQTDTEGWLCPGLIQYYREAPKELYAKAEAKK
jgi:hypothetical protein